jgi:hypothetical protein
LNVAAIVRSWVCNFIDSEFKDVVIDPRDRLRGAVTSDLQVKIFGGSSTASGISLQLEGSSRDDSVVDPAQLGLRNTICISVGGII